MARPTKLTPEAQRRICEALAGGNTRADAAHYAGIDARSFYYWMRKGAKAKKGKYVQFFRAVRKAEADCAVRCAARIQHATGEDWRAAAWWLERRRHQQFGNKDTTTVKGPGKGGAHKHEVAYVNDFYSRPESAENPPAESDGAPAAGPS